MITFKCFLCQKEKTVYPAYIRAREKMGIKHLYCSRTCFANWLKTQTGYWKGKKVPYKKRNRQINGEMNPNWKGGRRPDKSGYILIHQPTHPFCDGDGYVREHRLVLEKQLGRYLLTTEVVHHINHKKNDNRPKNLMLFKDCSEHRKFHSKESQVVGTE